MEQIMAKCHKCHNDYDKTFEIIKDNKKYVFDSFECAIHELAPACSQCSCKIIGHGMEDAGKFFCCAHCAKKAGIDSLVDRAD